MLFFTLFPSLDAVNEDNHDNKDSDGDNDDGIKCMFIVYMSIINPSGDWEDSSSTKQSIARILDPGNSRENQLDFFSLDQEK